MAIDLVGFSSSRALVALTIVIASAAAFPAAGASESPQDYYVTGIAHLGGADKRDAGFMVLDNAGSIVWEVHHGDGEQAKDGRHAGIEDVWLNPEAIAWRRRA